jgi:hypothetical protein
MMKPVIEAVREAAEHGNTPDDIIRMRDLYEKCILSPSWMAKHAKTAQVDTHSGLKSFLSGSCLTGSEAPLSDKTFERRFMLLQRLLNTVLGSDRVMYLIRFAVYGIFAWLMTVIRAWLFKIFAIVALLWIEALPSKLFQHDSCIDAGDMGLLQRSRFLQGICEFFSYRFIVESKLNRNVPNLMLIKGMQIMRTKPQTVGGTGSTDARVSSEPQGSFDVIERAHLCHATLSAFMLHVFTHFIHGIQLTTGLPDYFKVEAEGYDGKSFRPAKHTQLSRYLHPVLERLGFKGSRSQVEFCDSVLDSIYAGGSAADSIPDVGAIFDSFDPATGEHVPSEQNSDVIRLALIVGYTIVPCVHMQLADSDEETSWDSEGRAKRRQMVLIYGKPIKVPRMVELGSTDISAVTEELVEVYLQRYIGETRRIAATYGNLFIGSDS